MDATLYVLLATLAATAAGFGLHPHEFSRIVAVVPLHAKNRRRLAARRGVDADHAVLIGRVTAETLLRQLTGAPKRCGAGALAGEGQAHRLMAAAGIRRVNAKVSPAAAVDALAIGVFCPPFRVLANRPLANGPLLVCVAFYVGAVIAFCIALFRMFAAPSDEEFKA